MHQGREERGPYKPRMITEHLKEFNDYGEYFEPPLENLAGFPLVPKKLNKDYMKHFLLPLISHCKSI